MNQKKTVVVITQLIIAVLFIIGADWAGDTISRLFHSYFADIAIPFSFYLLVILLEDRYKPLHKWYVKAIAVFILCSIAETLQFFGIYALGETFDPWDYAMYALGAVLAVAVDRIIFKRLFSFWQ